MDGASDEDRTYAFMFLEKIEVTEKKVDDKQKQLFCNKGPCDLDS